MPGKTSNIFFLYIVKAIAQQVATNGRQRAPFLFILKLNLCAKNDCVAYQNKFYTIIYKIFLEINTFLLKINIMCMMIR